MFQWRLKLREAKQALAEGRVDEARAIVDDAELREFLPAKQLAGQVAEKFAERARQRIAWGESAAGLDDLEKAEQLGGGVSTPAAILHKYARSTAQQAVARLVAGEPEAALKRLERARRRGVVEPTLRDASEIAQLWVASRQQAAEGEMAEAQDALARAGRLAEALAGALEANPPSGLIAGVRDAFGLGKMTIPARIAEATAQLESRAAEHHAARERLHAAAAAQQWDDALSAVEESLRLAPRDPVALGLRRRLWKEVGMGLTRSHPGRRQSPTPLAMPNHQPGQRSRELAQALRDDNAAGNSTQRPKPSKDDTAAGVDKAPGGGAADRRMLWVDAVGGYLVCLDDEVVIGQPSSDTTSPGLPILADISRRHAVLRRESGAYLLEPISGVLLDGRPITGPTPLGDSHVIELASPTSAQGGVRLQFTRPHALSATARLEVESGHRTSPSADGVLLMAESCVLGPGGHSHVRCRGWKEDVILFRKNTGRDGVELHCRSAAPLEVDGLTADGPVSIEPGSRVEGEDFALSVELA